MSWNLRSNVVIKGKYFKLLSDCITFLDSLECAGAVQTRCAGTGRSFIGVVVPSWGSGFVIINVSWRDSWNTGQNITHYQTLCGVTLMDGSSGCLACPVPCVESPSSGIPEQVGCTAPRWHTQHSGWNYSTDLTQTLSIQSGNVFFWNNRRYTCKYILVKRKTE